MCMMHAKCDVSATQNLVSQMLGPGQANPEHMLDIVENHIAWTEQNAANR